MCLIRFLESIPSYILHIYLEYCLFLRYGWYDWYVVTKRLVPLKPHFRRLINCWFFKLPLSHLSWETLYSVPSSCFRHFLTIFTKVNMLLSIKFNWNWWNKKNPTGTNTSFLRELWWVKCQLEMPWFLLSIVLGHFFNVINFGKFFFLKGESVWYLIYYLLLNILSIYFTIKYLWLSYD